MRVAFTGKSGVGKTTAAKYLVEYHNFQVFGFANKLKAIVSDLWDVGFTDKHDSKYANKRILLQDVGLSMRELDPDVWLRPVGRWLSGRRVLSNLVIDDLRFDNEAEYLRRHGFTIVELARDIQPSDDDHPSEAGLTVHNDFYVVGYSLDTLVRDVCDRLGLDKLGLS